MFRRLRWGWQNWSQRKVDAMADLVWAVRETNPDWKQIQIDRKFGGVVLSVVTDTSVQIDHLHETD